MFKKLVILILCFSFISFWNVFAWTQTQDEKDAIAASLKNYTDIKTGPATTYDTAVKTAKTTKNSQISKAESTYTSEYDKAIADYDKTSKSWQAKLDHHLKIDALEKAETDSIKSANDSYDKILTESKSTLDTAENSNQWNVDKARAQYNDSLTKNWTLQQKKQWYEWELDDAKRAEWEACKGWASAWCTEAIEATATATTEYNDAKDEYDDSTAAEWDITSRGYQIMVNDISPWMDVKWGTTKENVNFALATIIQNLMIALWSLALLIMTVWAWYIVLHNGQDELLSKWKSIFMSWVYALIVALSSYYLINIIRFILFQWS